MSNGVIPQITLQQQGQYITVNDNFRSLIGSNYGAVDDTRTAGLSVWILRGLSWDGSAYQIDDDVNLTLTGSADNYVEQDPVTRAITSNTSAFTAGKRALQKLTTNATGITTRQDYRSIAWNDSYAQFGAMKLSVTGSGGGITVGGDVQWYRDSANVWRTPDAVTIDGRLGIGGDAATSVSLHLKGSITGAASAFSILNDDVIQSDVTSEANYFRTRAETAAASFTLTSLYHFLATQDVIGAGSTVTNQYGFRVSSSLIGGTNNYGFAGHIDSGANRWNFYASGTANNAFAGNVRVGSTVAPTVALDVTGEQIITASGSADALRITQTGAGNALLVEDEANPDSTPVVIDTDGRVLVGNTGALQVAGASRFLEVMGTSGATAGISIAEWITAAGAASPVLNFGRSRNATIGSYTAVAANDALGTMQFAGDDGTDLNTEAARLAVFCDGTVATDQVPGRFVFSTANSAGTLTERLRIDSSGSVLIANATSPTGTPRVAITDGSLSLVVGADSGAQTLTNATIKDTRIGFPHYTNAEEVASLVWCTSTVTNNRIVVGGGTSLMNAATLIDFYSATNNTTTTGTLMARITSSGLTHSTAGALRIPDGARIGADSTNNLLDDATNGAGSATMFIGNASINVTSDERVKSNVRRWDGDASAILRGLPVKAWDRYLSDAPMGGYDGGYVGFTAQDLHAAAPWTVNTQGDTGLPWQARYEFLNGVIVKGWQDHDERIKALEEKLH